MVFELKHYQGLRLRTIGEMLNTTEETANATRIKAERLYQEVHNMIRQEIGAGREVPF